jgi:hypothetical protein
MYMQLEYIDQVAIPIVPGFLAFDKLHLIV